MAILKAIYIIGGALLIALSLPLILRRIPPNAFYGFRVRWTMEDPELWYPVNAYAGKWMALVGCCSILGSIGLALLPGIPLGLYAFGCLGVFAAAFTLALVQSIRYLRAMDSQK
ncbi:MAG: SdpI family protein [Anaerolineales bacterium]|nr:SdpI family protein [Anaerolineales bacterium]